MGMYVPWHPGFGGESGVMGRSIFVIDLGRVGDGTRARVVIVGGKEVGLASGAGSGGGVVGVVGGGASWKDWWVGGD